jgi:hypothetical protein
MHYEPLDGRSSLYLSSPYICAFAANVKEGELISFFVAIQRQRRERGKPALTRAKRKGGQVARRIKPRLGC